VLSRILIKNLAQYKLGLNHEEFNMAVNIPGYETTFIHSPDVTDESLATLKKKLEGVIASFGGELVQTDDWGKRKLAYPIRKETRGHYTFMLYTGKPGVVAEMERTLRIQDNVIRFLSINLEQEFDVSKYEKKLTNPDQTGPVEREAPRGAGRRPGAGGGDRGDRFERGDRGGRGDDRGERYDRPDRGDRGGRY
jgi:small subunit ribosomal protein S6